MVMKPIDNYSEVMTSELIEEYKDSPNFQKTIDINSSDIQELDILFQDMLGTINLRNAYGDILDRIGGNFGELRGGVDDEQYRLNIYTQIAINNGGCDPEFILTTVRRLVDPVSITYAPLYPANFSLNIRKDNIDLDVLPLIRSLPAAGVGDILITISPEAELLLWSGIIGGEYELLLNDQDGQFPLIVEEVGDTIYTLAVEDFVPLEAPNSQGWAGTIPTPFLATDDEGATITFSDGTPWQLSSEGDEEFYTTTEYGGVFSGAI